MAVFLLVENGTEYPIRQFSPYLHARMYACADFYVAFALKELAKEKFHAAAKSYPATRDFFKSMRIVYKTTLAEDKGLRNIVKETIPSNMNLLKIEEVGSALRELPDLSFELLQAYVGARGRRD
jgi:hypothetical protein